MWFLKQIVILFLFLLFNAILWFNGQTKTSISSRYRNLCIFSLVCCLVLSFQFFIHNFRAFSLMLKIDFRSMWKMVESFFYIISPGLLVDGWVECGLEKLRRCLDSCFKIFLCAVKAHTEPANVLLDGKRKHSKEENTYWTFLILRHENKFFIERLFVQNWVVMTLNFALFLPFSFMNEFYFLREEKLLARVFRCKIFTSR